MKPNEQKEGGQTDRQALNCVGLAYIYRRRTDKGVVERQSVCGSCMFHGRSPEIRGPGDKWSGRRMSCQFMGRDCNKLGETRGRV